MKNTEQGRSMVEMLGVLAIIAVLSLGALAGFNKAMAKHKLNKLAEEINYMLQTAITHNDDLKTASFDMINELKALGAFNWNISTSLGDIGVLNNQYVHFQDSLHNDLWFENYHELNNGGYAFSVALNLSENITEICYNYINVFRNFATEVDGIYVTKKSEGKSLRNAFAGRICASGRCLATISNSDIVDMCATHCADAERCTLYVLWDYPAATAKALFN